ncbi:hypothetical protein ABW19_dt0210491 [Dactylella cylindrospora]|nr:hypothetical protein ABW19_dt0210491 [Dactylella cylindrospora]
MMCACAPALKPLFKSLSTPFTSKNDATNSYSQPAERANRGSATPSALSSLARNRAKFEVAHPDHRRDEGRVVEITGGTPYYTPLLEPAVTLPASVKSRQSSSPVSNLQLDGSVAFKRAASTPNIYNQNTKRKLSRLAGEYTATCSSTLSLSENKQPDQEFFGLISRPSIWRRPSSMSRRSYSESPPDSTGTNDLEVKIKHEVRIDYEPMTPEEQERWEKKRSILDAVDNLW